MYHDVNTRASLVYRCFISQVEYLPSNRIRDGLAMISALMPSIADNFVSASDLLDARVFGAGPFFSVQHASLQTTDLFNRIFAS